MRFKGNPEIGCSVSTSKKVGLDHMFNNVQYHLYLPFLLPDINLYGINQAIYAAYCGRGIYRSSEDLEVMEGKIIQWGDGVLKEQDIVGFLREKQLPCMNEFI